MKNKKVGKICPRCHKQYQLGWTGIVGSCDECAGVQRDVHNIVWQHGDEEQRRIIVATGEEEVVTREEAFRKK